MFRPEQFESSKAKILALRADIQKEAPDWTE
jgi:hypothetical protein